MHYDVIYGLLLEISHKEMRLKELTLFTQITKERFCSLSEAMIKSLIKGLFKALLENHKSKEKFIKDVSQLFPYLNKEHNDYSSLFYDQFVDSAKYEHFIDEKSNKELAHLLKMQENFHYFKTQSSKEIKSLLKDIDIEYNNNEKNLANYDKSKIMENNVCYSKRTKLTKMKKDIIQQMSLYIEKEDFNLTVSTCYTKKHHIISLSDNFMNRKSGEALCTNKKSTTRKTLSSLKYVECKACINKMITLYSKLKLKENF